jgi:CRISPR system Cascade subunit CasA
MLTQHVYGLSGRARVSGKLLGPKLTNLATGRLLSRIRVVVQGRTVGDTLRLNLYPVADGRVGRFNTSWTAEGFARRGFRTKPPGRATDGPADLHSALGRSVLLRPARQPAADGRILVDRVLIGAGELLALDPERDLEDAVPHRAGKPLWPSPKRALWREAHALYSAARDAEHGLFGRLRRLTFPADGDGPPCVLWAVGLVANKTVPLSWTDGSFPYAPSQGEELCEASKRGSDVVEHVAWVLERAAYAVWRIVYANPKPADGPAQRARFDAGPEFWQAAKKHFEVLLERTAWGDPVDPAVRDYADQLADDAHRFLRHRLDSLPRNDTGLRARARAEQRFREDMTGPKAPADLRGDTRP